MSREVDKNENKKDNKKHNNDKEEFIIEDAFNRLARINELLESKDTNLKESVELYSEGVKLVAACRENLCGVEKEIQILNEV